MFRKSLLELIFFSLIVWGCAVSLLGQTNDEKLAKANAIMLEAEGLFNQGTAKSYRLALQKYNEASRLYGEISDKSEKAGLSILMSGFISDKLGEKSEALKYYEQALNFFQTNKSKNGEAATLNNIGLVYSSLGEKQKALEFYHRALPLTKEIGDKKGEAITLSNIGVVYNSLGEKQKALEFYQQSLKLKKEIGDKKGEAVTLSNIGTLYNSLGEKQKALEFFNQGLRLSKEMGDKAGEAAMLGNVGAVYSSLGERQKALEFYNRSLQLKKEVGDKKGEATTLNNIGLLYLSLGEKQKALDYYNLALSLRKEVGDKAGEATTLTGIGLVYSSLGEKQKALEFYNRSLELKKEVGDKTGEAITLNNLMVVWKSLNNPRFAIFYGKQSVNLYQELRTNIQGLETEIQKTYLSSIDDTYRRLAGILIEEGRIAEAQQVLDLLKDQQFFDFNHNLNEPAKQIVQTAREAKSSADYAKSSGKIGIIRQQIEELKRRIGIRQPTSGESAQLRKFEIELKIVTDEFLDVINQFRIDFAKPIDEKDKVSDVPNHREMKTALSKLTQQTGQKTVAVYTSVSEDKYYALIVSSDGIKAVSSPISGTNLNNKALKLWGLLQSDKYETTVLSKQIYDTVFKPIEAELPKGTTAIMWSLDGNLRYIPMAALWDGKQFLAERFNHIVFTRADSERMVRNLNPNWTGLGLGTTQPQTVELLGDKISFSALPGVNEEFKEIFKQSGSKTGILNGEVFSDGKFTKNNFLESLKQRRPVVHIASHFSFRPGDEARSFLLLGDGTAYPLNEMKKEINLFQGVDLLALSACNTAATQTDANGREIDGFAELAQRLGAGAVMATLWSVSDASTPWLMRDFYSNKLSIQGMTKAEALRKAQLALLNGTAQTKPLPQNEKGTAENKVQIVIISKGGSRSGNTTRSDVIYLDEEEAPLYKKEGKGKFSHPYFWSPFILIGNWR